MVPKSDEMVTPTTSQNPYRAATNANDAAVPTVGQNKPNEEIINPPPPLPGDKPEEGGSSSTEMDTSTSAAKAVLATQLLDTAVASVLVKVKGVLSESEYCHSQMEAATRALATQYRHREEEWFAAVVNRLMDEGPKSEFAFGLASSSSRTSMTGKSQLSSWPQASCGVDPVAGFASKQTSTTALGDNSAPDVVDITPSVGSNALALTLPTTSSAKGTDNRPSNVSTAAATNTTPTFTKEEEEIAKAIEASINDQKGVQAAVSGFSAAPDPINPHERQRSSAATPVGLKNVGNTCWFNAIAQALFAIPRIRQAVFNWSPDNNSQASSQSNQDATTEVENGDEKKQMPMETDQNEASSSTSTTVNVEPRAKAARRDIEEEAELRGHFLIALRRLFALLAASDKAYVDPTTTLAALRRHPAVRSDQAATIGVSQHDVEEMFLRIVDWLEQGFAASPLANAKQSRSTPTPDSPPSIVGDEEETAKTETEKPPPTDEADSSSLGNTESAVTVTSMETATTTTCTSSITVTMGRPETEMTVLPDGGSGDSQQEEGDDDEGNLIRQLFYGSMIERRCQRSSDENDGDADIAYSEQTVSGLQHHTIPIESHSGRFLDAMETLLWPPSSQGTMNYFSRLPRILLVSQRRFNYNQSSKQTEKLHGRLEFPQRFYIDRFLHANDTITGPIFETVERKRVELRRLKDKLQKAQKYGESQESLPVILKDVLRYYGADMKSETEVKDTAAEPMDTSEGATENTKENNIEMAPTEQHFTVVERELLRKYLQQSLDRVQKEMDACAAELCAQEKEINEAYDMDSLRKHEYRLHAVFVHSGEAGTGHYWTFIGGDAEKWTKYNDRIVCESSWDELCKDSYGGDGGFSSAYCLLYVRTDEQNTLFNLPQNAFGEVSSLPLDLAQFVSEDNERFAKELSDYDLQVAARAVENWDEEDVAALLNENANETSKTNPVPAPIINALAERDNDHLLTRSEGELERIVVEHRSWSYSLIGKHHIMLSDWKNLPTDSHDAMCVTDLLLKQASDGLERKLTELLAKWPMNPLLEDCRLTHILCFLASAAIKETAPLTELMLLETFAGGPPRDTITLAARAKCSSLFNALSEEDQKNYRFYHCGYRTFLEAVLVVIQICCKYKEKDYRSVCLLWSHLARKYTSLRRLSGWGDGHFPFRPHAQALCKSAIAEWSTIAGLEKQGSATTTTANAEPLRQYISHALPLLAEIADGKSSAPIGGNDDKGLAKNCGDWLQAVTTLWMFRLTAVNDQKDPSKGPTTEMLMKMASTMNDLTDNAVLRRQLRQTRSSFTLRLNVIGITLGRQLADVAHLLSTFEDEKAVLQRLGDTYKLDS